MKLQWHTAFYAAIRIELGEELDKLQIEEEHLLGKKPMQLIITKDLSKEENYWLQNLRKDLQSGGEIQILLEKYDQKKNSNLHQAVMDVILRANWERVKEEKGMCEALRELFAEELEESREQGIEQGVKKGLEEGIRVLIETCKEFSMSREKTADRLVHKFELSQEKAAGYMRKYWN